MLHNGVYWICTIASVLAAGLSGSVEPKVLKQEEALALFDSITAEHQKALDKLSTLEFSYSREFDEIREIDGAVLRVFTKATGMERSKGEWLNCTVKYEQRFPDGNPKGYAEFFEKHLVLNQDMLATWTTGTYVANAWKLDALHLHSGAIQHQVQTTKCPLLIKAYGDDNMSFAEFRAYLSQFPGWHIEISINGTGNECTYTISQFQQPDNTMPYKRIVLSPHHGYMVQLIERFGPSGGLMEQILVTPKEIRPGPWVPERFEVTGYNIDDNFLESAETDVVYRSNCVLKAFEIPETTNEAWFSIGALGALDGQVFNVQLDSGKQEVQILYQDKLLQREAYQDTISKH